MTILRFQTFPPIDDPVERDYTMLGLAWAFHPYREHVEIHVDVSTKMETRARLPTSLDPKSLDYLKQCNLVVRSCSDTPPSHALMLNHQARLPHWALSRIDIDRKNIPHHLWELQRLLADFFGDMKKTEDGSRLRKLKTRNFQRAYLFGSGPTLSSLEPDSLEDGVRIICSGVALNRRANEIIRPHLLVAIDPLHHCGFSGYAGEFVEATRELMNAYGTQLVTRREFLPWYRDRLPMDQVIGLDFIANAPFHSNLDQGAWLANANGNVLCAGALPLGAYLADELVLLGFDGREPDRDKSAPYCWRHDPQADVDNWEGQVPIVNPAVFARDFDLYLENHAREIAGIFSILEGRGQKVHRLAPSHIRPISQLRPLKEEGLRIAN